MLRRVALSTALLVCIAATASGAVPERDHARGQPPLAAAAAAADSDHDGLSDRLETRKYHTNPRRRDTDRDGLRDRAEIRRYHTNPRRRDTDRDGLWDRAEIRRYHTNPRRRGLVW